MQHRCHHWAEQEYVWWVRTLGQNKVTRDYSCLIYTFINCNTVASKGKFKKFNCMLMSETVLELVFEAKHRKSWNAEVCSRVSSLRYVYLT